MHNITTYIHVLHEFNLAGGMLRKIVIYTVFSQHRVRQSSMHAEIWISAFACISKILKSARYGISDFLIYDLLALPYFGVSKIDRVLYFRNNLNIRFPEIHIGFPEMRVP